MERFVLKHLCDKIRKMPTDMGRYWMDFSIFLNKKKLKKKLLSFPTSYLLIQNLLPYLATQITNGVLKYFYSGIFLSRKCFIEQPISLFTRYAFFSTECLQFVHFSLSSSLLSALYVCRELEWLRDDVSVFLHRNPHTHAYSVHRFLGRLTKFIYKYLNLFF